MILVVLYNKRFTFVFEDSVKFQIIDAVCNVYIFNFISAHCMFLCACLLFVVCVLVILRVNTSRLVLLLFVLCCIVCLILIDSFESVYFAVLDVRYSITNTLIVTGNQWFWSYNYADYMCAVIGRADYTVCGVSVDVIHSWFIPSLALKLDLIPGQIYVGYFNTNSIVGIVFGQCAEFCGLFHPYMPTILVVL